MIDERYMEEFAGLIQEMKTLLEKAEFRTPSLGIECTQGNIELLLAGWDGSNWVTRPIANLSSGQSRNVILNPIQEGTSKKVGEHLLIRTNSSGVYTIVNFESFYLLYVKVTPALFPWWQGTKEILPRPSVIFGGQKLEATIQSSTAPVQDVFYYFRVA